MSIAHAIMPASANQPLDLPCNVIFAYLSINMVKASGPSSSMGGQLYSGLPARKLKKQLPPPWSTFLYPPLCLLSQKVACSLGAISAHYFADDGESGIWNTRWTLKHSWHISVTTCGWLQTREVGKITSRVGSAAVLIWLILICYRFYETYIAVFQRKFQGQTLQLTSADVY